LREPNLGKTNPRVTLYSLAICFAPSLADSIIFLTLTRLVVVIIFENFSFALFTPPLGDFQFCVDNEQSEVSECVVGDFLEQQSGEGKCPLTHYILFTL
jgi:hypothetical protein